MGTNGGLCNSGQSRLDFSRLGRRSGHCRLQGPSFRFTAHFRSFPPFGGADIAGLQGLIFRLSGHIRSYPALWRSGDCRFAGAEFSFSLSFPLVSPHSGNSGVAAGSRQTRRDFRRVVYVIRYRHSTNVRKGTPSVVDIAPMLERGHQAWQGANDTSFSSKCDCPGVQLLILRLRVCAGLDLRLAGSRYTM